MKKLMTIGASVCLLTSTSLFASVCTKPTNIYFKAFNAAATAIALVSSYEITHWNDQSIDFSNQDIEADATCAATSAAIACSTVRDNSLLSTLTADTDTGAIVLTFKNAVDVSPLLRAATITLTPKSCSTSADSTQTCAAYTERSSATSAEGR